MPTSLTRLEDWEVRLGEVLLKAHFGNVQYELCGLFVADAIEAMTGVDVAVAFRQCKSKREVAKLFGKSTTREIADTVAAEYGINEIDPAFAQRGDVLAIEQPDGQEESLGMLDLRGTGVACVTPSGVNLAPIETVHVLKAWHVGELA